MDLHAAYQLAPEIDHITGKEISSKPKGRRRSGNAMGTDQDVRRGMAGTYFPGIHLTDRGD